MEESPSLYELTDEAGGMTNSGWLQKQTIESDKVERSNS
jgi:hypothetical protein